MSLLLSLIGSKLGGGMLKKLLPLIVIMASLIWGYYYINGKINDRVTKELKSYKDSVTLQRIKQVEKDSETIKDVYTGPVPSNISDATARVLERAKAHSGSELQGSGRSGDSGRELEITKDPELG